MKLFRSFLTSFRLAKLAWVALFLGVCAFLVSLYLDFEIASSGAVMICSVIIAELSYRQAAVSAVAIRVDGQWVRKHFVSGVNSSDVIFLNYKDKPVVGKALGAGNIRPTTHPKIFKVLMTIEKHLLPLSGDAFSDTNGAWNFSAEYKKIDRVFGLAAAIVAVLGSLIWAYGHRIWDN